MDDLRPRTASVHEEWRVGLSRMLSNRMFLSLPRFYCLP